MSFAMKKKIIFITQALWIGGIETALVNLLNNFDYNTYDVTCLVIQSSLELVNRITPKCRIVVADRFQTVTFENKYRFSKLYGLIQEPETSSRLRKYIWRIFRFLFRALENQLYSNYIKKEFNNEHFDTAVIYTNRVSELAIKSINADKFITFFHHGSFHREYHDMFGYKEAQKIIVVSEPIKNQIEKAFPRYASKIIVLHNIIDIDYIRKRSLEESISLSDGFNIVSCGRLHHDKGFDLAVEACKRLVDDGYTNLHWYVVGEGPESNNLRDLIEEYNASEHFHLLGVKSNPYPYMKVADIFVQSSRIEAFGLTITEALSLGVPVVSTATDGGKEIITDNVNGLLCDVSADSIYRAVKTLIENPELRKKLADGASEIDFEAQNDEIMKRLYAEL